jgi:hypothetical protein
VNEHWKGGYGIFQYIIAAFRSTDLLNLRMSDHNVVFAAFCLLNVLLPVWMCSILAGLFQSVHWRGCRLDKTIPGRSFGGIQRQGCEFPYLSPSNAKVENEWSRNSITPYDLISCTGTNLRSLCFNLFRLSRLSSFLYFADVCVRPVTFWVPNCLPP